MRDAAHLRQCIDQNVFDYQQLVACLSHYSKPRDKIRRLLASGDLVRIRKGLYTFGEPYRRAPMCRELLANLIYGPSYVSLDYALSYHGLIPERVETVTSVTTGRSRAFETPFGSFSYRRLSEDRYAVGVLLEQQGSVSFLIASPEKALVDKVWADKRFAGTRLSDFGPYLLEDLRIDLNRLASLDRDRLGTITESWNSQQIRLLARYLTSLTERDHA